jgi:hypothetical protein
MSLLLTEEQTQALQETRIAEDQASFQALLKEAEPELVDIFETNENEVKTNNEPIPEILIELRDLYFSAKQNQSQLAKNHCGPERIKLFRDAIRLLDTVFTWFGEGSRTGLYRPKTIEQIVEDSRSWRDEIRLISSHAFVRNKALKEQFADVNSTGTLDEESEDLKVLNSLIGAHQKKLTEFGLTEEQLKRGKELQEQAEGRDLLAVLGFRSLDDARYLRNKMVTYAIFMAQEIRIAGEKTFQRDPQKRKLFTLSSFRNTLRSIQAKRGAREEKPTESAPPTEEKK